MIIYVIDFFFCLTGEQFARKVLDIDPCLLMDGIKIAIRLCIKLCGWICGAHGLFKLRR